MHGDNQYQIQYRSSVVKQDIPCLSAPVKKRIQKAIEERLMTDPVAFGKPLRFNLKGLRRLRVGDYRVVYEIDQANHFVNIIAIKHRKEVYAESQ